MNSRVTKINAFDQKFMALALRLAERGLGQVWPNPAVGCLLVCSGKIVARGWTQPGGRPHAETEALRRLPKKLTPLTAYVTLEPCAHHGNTPPCVEALIDAGVTRCVVAILDPDPRVSGRGVERLKAAGISVEVGLLSEKAEDLNSGFLSRVIKSVPMTTIKLATSMDGCIATRSGNSKWITGPTARARAHLMRAEHDAIMIGAQTARQDNPHLTCRLPGMRGRSPVRVVLDTHLSLPLDAHLVATALEVPTWIITATETKAIRSSPFEKAGVTVLRVKKGEDGMLRMGEIMSELARRGITRVLVEGGQKIITSLMRAELVARVSWFRAPRIIGEDGVRAIGALGLDDLEMVRRWRRVSWEQLGEDTLECFVHED